MGNLGINESGNVGIRESGDWRIVVGIGYFGLVGYWEKEGLGDEQIEELVYLVSGELWNWVIEKY